MKNEISFAPSVGTRLKNVATSHLNEDDLLDIIVVNEGTDSIGVLLGYGNGTFENQLIFPTGLKSHPDSIAIHDFNKDEQVDITVINHGTNNFVTLLGKGNGMFENHGSYGASFDFSPVVIGLGDFNNDDYSEIVVAYDNSDHIDIFAQHDIGAFPQRMTYLTDTWSFAVAVSDFNNDSHLDIVVTTAYRNVIDILLGNGNGSFTRVAAYLTGALPESVAVGDFNNDARLDIIVANCGNNTVILFFGSGNGTFPTDITHSTGSLPRSVAVGDFNRDSKLDAVIVNSGSNSVTLLLGSGNGTFPTELTYSTGSLPQSIAVGDFNSDASLDIAVANYGDNTISVLLGYGDGSFTSQIIYASGASPLTVVVGDFNNDTRLDLVLTNQIDGCVSVLLGVINQAFLKAETLITGNGSQPSSVVIADYNNDNKKDIAIANLGTNTIDIFLGNGNSSFTSQKSLLTGSTPKAVAIGDFNNDNIIDIVVANYDSGNVGVFLGCGNGSFLSQKTFTTGSQSYPIEVAVGDFNSDTFVDIIIANYGINTVGILLGYGNGSFTNVKLFSISYASYPFSISVGDFNGDRKLDFVIVNEGSDNLETFLQTC
ncbi:unnamed protein product [Rotaria socialis]|nr:unnamed protein product [Rotaria socialis]